ncbi:MAG: diguanylate cyclase [Methylovulum sp.]|nr:diguanylate cyclase [Methylovulum sp.]
MLNGPSFFRDSEKGLDAKKGVPSVLVPVLFFLLFDCFALSLNYLISYRLSENAVAINLAGRQRMLSQQMTKAVLMFQSADGADKATALHELQDTVALFDQTLHAFWEGGKTLDGAYQQIALAPITAANARTHLANALKLWTPVYKELKPFTLMVGYQVNLADTGKAVGTLVSYNRKLLQQMNALTLTLEKNSTTDASHLRLFQRIFLILALVNFAFVYFRLRGNIRQTLQNNAAMRNVFNSIDTSIILYGNDGQILSSNKAAETLFGYLGESLKHKNIDDLIRDNDVEISGVRHNGQHFKVAINHQQIYQQECQINICTVHDISEQQQKEDMLTRLAFHDALTGLPNRVLFYERLQHDLLHAKRNSSLMAVLFLDLDGFKAVNDCLGHETGDQLLKMVAQRLTRCCREDDTVARLGGDEFTIVLASIQSLDNMHKIANNILASISQNFVIHQHKIYISISIGISIYPSDHQEAEMLLKYADDAMYQAKKAGKNKYHFAAGLTL